ncbi:MAG: hypothetical protein GF411_20510 [Candidatus Lokiarchaeota archaeon]|nr:hypothetical protein [Candidatus Lokiarchaeota archaeon]
MPYIPVEAREELDNSIENLANSLTNEGEVNYAITRILSIACGVSEPRYSKINKAIGILECAKLEFYRRLAKYEDKKIDENGDVYEYKESKV